jgi:hypothetical protein
MFIFDFGDLSSANKEKISEAMGCPICDVFKTQRQADKAKKILGKSGFGKMLTLYFNQFQGKDGVDFKKLDAEISKNKKVFLRHLGKDKVNYLSLMISIAQSIESKKRGLLEVAS